jgi:hypothetical protein
MMYVMVVILEYSGEKLNVAHIIHKSFSFLIFCCSELNHEKD